jgi:hypothetical protein
MLATKHQFALGGRQLGAKVVVIKDRAIRIDVNDVEIAPIREIYESSTNKETQAGLIGSPLKPFFVYEPDSSIDDIVGRHVLEHISYNLIGLISATTSLGLNGERRS